MVILVDRAARRCIATLTSTRSSKSKTRDEHGHTDLGAAGGRNRATAGDCRSAPGAAFHQDFIPHGHAVDLLVKIAASDARFAADARAVLEEWRNGLATPEQMRRVVTNDELEVGGGAVVSEADDGYWITTWTWVGDG
jgi:hypothetical protein